VSSAIYDAACLELAQRLGLPLATRRTAAPGAPLPGSPIDRITPFSEVDYTSFPGGLPHVPPCA